MPDCRHKSLSRTGAASASVADADTEDCRFSSYSSFSSLQTALLNEKRKKRKTKFEHQRHTQQHSNALGAHTHTHSLSLSSFSHWHYYIKRRHRHHRDSSSSWKRRHCQLNAGIITSAWSSSSSSSSVILHCPWLRGTSPFLPAYVLICTAATTATGAWRTVGAQNASEWVSTHIPFLLSVARLSLEQSHQRRWRRGRHCSVSQRKRKRERQSET